MLEETRSRAAEFYWLAGVTSRNDTASASFRLPFLHTPSQLKPQPRRANMLVNHRPIPWRKENLSRRPFRRQAMSKR